MINSKELRIGNYACVGKTEDGLEDIGIIVKVEDDKYKQWNGSFFDNGYSFLPLNPRYETDYYECDEFYPIPITEEWIRDKFKLNVAYKSNYTARYEFPDLPILEIRFNVKDKPTLLYGGQPIPDLDYIHQIQNLYNILSVGKELTIKE